jgi:uncharacterized membrane protein YhaH (DUF805 family)
MNPFKQYFLDVIVNHYADFKGNATRKEFWLFILFDFIIAILIGMLIDGLILEHLLEYEGIISISDVYSLATSIPTLALCVRRLRDIRFPVWLVVFPVLASLLAYAIWAVILLSEEVGFNLNEIAIGIASILCLVIFVIFAVIFSLKSKNPVNNPA